ncbi:MAG: hypothetical protein Q8O87_00675 [bacterium]|nr:hypothetical protein [bacterium]
MTGVSKKVIAVFVACVFAFAVFVAVDDVYATHAVVGADWGKATPEQTELCNLSIEVGDKSGYYAFCSPCDGLRAYNLNLASSIFDNAYHRCDERGRLRPQECKNNAHSIYDESVRAINKEYSECASDWLNNPLPYKQFDVSVPIDFEPLSCPTVSTGGSGAIGFPAIMRLGESLKQLPMASALASFHDLPDPAEIARDRVRLAALERELSDAAWGLKRLQNHEQHLLDTIAMYKKSANEYDVSFDEAIQRNEAELATVVPQLAEAESFYSQIKNKYDALAMNIVEKEQRLIEEEARKDRVEQQWEARIQGEKDRQDFQRRRDNAEIPQNSCFGSDCKAGQQAVETYNCKYAYLDADTPPTFWKGNPYALSEEDIDGLGFIFDNINNVEFGLSMLREPTRLKAIKFIVGKVTGWHIVTDLDDLLASPRDLLTDTILDAIKIIQKKLGILYAISIPVEIMSLEFEETFTCLEDGKCKDVAWDREITRQELIDVETKTIKFDCELYYDANFSDGKFSFNNEEEQRYLYRICGMPEDPRVFSNKIVELSARAMSIALEDHVNDTQCPKQ